MERALLAGDRQEISVSSLQHTGLEELLMAIDAALIADPLIEGAFRLPQSEGAIMSEKKFEGNLVFLRARGPASLLNRYRRFRNKHDLLQSQQTATLS